MTYPSDDGIVVVVTTEQYLYDTEETNTKRELAFGKVCEPSAVNCTRPGVGAPDLVVEVLSIGTARRDRHEKLDWYRHYGVRECWLIDLPREQVVVVDFAASAERTATGIDAITSTVFPALDASAFGVFA